MSRTWDCWVSSRSEQTFISQNVLINRIRSIQKFQHFRTGRNVRRVYSSVYNIYSRAQKSENLYYCHINLSESNISQKSRTVMIVAGLSEQYRDSRDLDQYPTHRTEQRNIQQLILMFPTDLCTQHITHAASFYQWSYGGPDRTTHKQQVLPTGESVWCNAGLQEGKHTWTRREIGSWDQLTFTRSEVNRMMTCCSWGWLRSQRAAAEIIASHRHWLG